MSLKGQEKLVFFVKSGTKKLSYSVICEFRDGALFVRCNCQAGRFGKFCKHKIGLIQGDFGILSNDEQIEDLSTITEWIQNSDFLDLIFERSPFKKPLIDAQTKVEEIRKQMRPVEKKMALAMKSGIKRIPCLRHKAVSSRACSRSSPLHSSSGCDSYWNP